MATSGSTAGGRSRRSLRNCRPSRRRSPLGPIGHCWRPSAAIRMHIRTMKLRTLTLAFALVIPTLAFARAPQQNAARPMPKPVGFHAEFLANLDEVQDKLMDLAESTPADKYGWRPANGVRSISEVY